MRILLINLEFDCAGVAWNLKNALIKAGHEVVHVALRPTNVAKNSDLFFDSVKDIIPYCEWADVLHFNQWIWTHIPGNAPLEFIPKNEYGVNKSPFESFLMKKKVVFHFHGGHLQLFPGYWLEECKRVNASVLKCDPISELGEAVWIPNIVDIDPAVAPFELSSEKLKIAIMGDKTDPRRNNGIICQVLDYLKKVLPIEYTCFWNLDRKAALESRKDFHLSIDNLTQGFVGMWSWESMMMGQAVIANIHNLAYMAYKTLCPAWPPFIHVANIDFMAKAIKHYLDRPEDLVFVRKSSLSWAKNAFSTDKLVKKYLEVYTS